MCGEQIWKYMCDKIDACIINHINAMMRPLQGMVGLLHQQVASSLFGTATEENVRNIAAVNSKLADAVEGVVSLQN